MDARLLHDLRNALSAAGVAVGMALETSESAPVGSIRRPLEVARASIISAIEVAGELESNPLTPSGETCSSD